MERTERNPRSYFIKKEQKKMKKFLCMILAIGMICGAATFAGCKKDKKDNDKQSSSQQSIDEGEGSNFVQSDDNVVEIPEGGDAWGDGWGI